MIDDDDAAETDLGRPDPESRARTHLANERTFLAWFRTGLTLIALGVAASQFLGPTPGDAALVQALGLITVGSGLLLIGGGYLRYRTARDEIEQMRLRAAGRSIELSVAVALAVGIVAIGFVLVVGRL